MAQTVTGEQYYAIDGQLAEIKRQLRQPSGYPFDPNQLKSALQAVVEGRFCLQPDILRPTEFDPASFIGIGWKFADTDADSRSLAFTEVDFSQVHYETCLKKGEQSITGEEKLKRLLGKGGSCLDPRFGVALLQEKGQQALERLNKKHGITYLDFFGGILVAPNGHRYVLYLCRHSFGGWYWDARWLGYGWYDRCFSARLAS